MVRNVLRVNINCCSWFSGNQNPTSNAQVVCHQIFNSLDQHNTDFNPFIKQVQCQAFHPKRKSEVGGHRTIQIWSRTYEALKKNDLWWPQKLLEGHKYPQLVKGLNLAKQEVSRTGDEQQAHECVHCEAKSRHARERQTVSRFRRS